MPDNTGKIFETRARFSERQAQQFLAQYFRNPVLAQCGECRGEEWRIYADDHRLSAMIMMQCLKCKRVVPPVEMRKPQMNDDIARRTGLILPDPWLSADRPGSAPRPIELDFEVETES